MSNNIDIKLDIDPEKIREVAKNKQLHEIISFIYEECSHNPEFNKLDQYEQMVLVEQFFVLKFTNFPAKIKLAAALALIEEDEGFNKLQSYQEKNEIRGMIKNIGVNIKQDDFGNFVYNEHVIESVKELYNRTKNERVCKTLIGPDNFKKVIG